MTNEQAAGRQSAKAGTVSQPSAHATRMRAAIAQAVAVGPGFLRGDIKAEHMAKAMVSAVHAYAERERTLGGGDGPPSAEDRALQDVLAELMACGSGYLAGRCDAACVGRTVTQMVHEFGGPH